MSNPKNTSTFALMTRNTRSGSISITYGYYQFVITREEAIRAHITLQGDEPNVTVTCVVWVWGGCEDGWQRYTPVGRHHIWTPDRSDFADLERVLELGIQNRIAA
jgi:hypothetical protein